MSVSRESQPSPPAALTREDAGYLKDLAPRQVQMIALGGAIGTGLFLGTGGRLASAGPGLFIAYAVCGGFVFLILRALGELVLHRPTSGSFVSYAREFFGEKTAFVTGWLYFLNWSMTGIVDTTAIASYLHYWQPLQVIPQWTLALAALLGVLSMNLISVKVFGELEFWAALVKVLALLTFVVVATIFLGGRHTIDGQETGLNMLATHGGLLPTGLLPLVLVTSGVVFSYAGVELVGTAAGETPHPDKVMPRAINSVVARIAIFYVGSVALLALLLPYTAFQEHQSPFVTFFSKVGFTGAGSMMNLVVLTAALSSLNAGLYSTGRIMRSMSVNGSGPAFTAKISKNGVPYGGILMISGVGLLGVLLNALRPGEAFEIVLNIASVGVVAAWATIVACQLRLYRLAAAGVVPRPSFRMPLAPYSGYVTLLFLMAVLGLMLFDHRNGPFVRGLLLIGVPALIAGWYLVRGRVHAAAALDPEPSLRPPAQPDPDE